MSLENLGNIGEFVAAVAVLVSIIYLAAQIRQNTAAVRGSTFLGATDSWQELMIHTSQPQQSSLFVRGTRAPDELTDEELQSYWYLTRTTFRRYENDFYQVKSRTFDKATWEGYRKSLLNDMFAYPAIRAMWQIQRESFGEEFTAFMDEQVKTARGIEAPVWTETWRRKVKEETTGA